MSYLNARYYGGTNGQFISQDSTFRAVGSPELSDILIRISGLPNTPFQSKFEKVKNREILQQFLESPQLLNSYSYARNNPVTYSDQTGEFGIFANIGFSAEAGLLSGFAGTISKGVGFVAGGPFINPQVETGSYDSYGGLVGGVFHGTTIEGSKGTDVNSMVVGANLGPSGGVMFTNATRLEQLNGITRDSWSLTLGLGTFQWSKSEDGSIWTFSVGLGTPGLSLSSYPTDTKVEPDKKDNK